MSTYFNKRLVIDTYGEQVFSFRQMGDNWHVSWNNPRKAPRCNFRMMPENGIYRIESEKRNDMMIRVPYIIEIEQDISDAIIEHLGL